MSDLQIVCDNCGAKYRLPASFSGDRAKCQKCGSAIDVAAQKALATAPAVAPAAAPARPAAKTPASAARAARGERAPRGERPARSARADASRSRRGKREQDEPKKKGHSMLLVGGGVAALAIVAVIVVLSTSNRNEPKPGAPDAATTPASAQHTDPGHAADAASSARWQNEPAKTMADVYRPQELGALSWPADVAAAVQTESRALAADVGAGHAAAARPKLEQLGYPAVFAILEALRQLDYTAVADQQKAAELNKALEAICAGKGAGFVGVATDGPLDPRLASWNARTNKVWAQWLPQWSSKAAFDAWKQQQAAAAGK